MYCTPGTRVCVCVCIDTGLGARYGLLLSCHRSTPGLGAPAPRRALAGPGYVNEASNGSYFEQFLWRSPAWSKCWWPSDGHMLPSYPVRAAAFGSGGWGSSGMGTGPRGKGPRELSPGRVRRVMLCGGIDGPGENGDTLWGQTGQVMLCGGTEGLQVRTVMLHGHNRLRSSSLCLSSQAFTRRACFRLFQEAPGLEAESSGAGPQIATLPLRVQTNVSVFDRDHCDSSQGLWVPDTHCQVQSHDLVRCKFLGFMVLLFS